MISLSAFKNRFNSLKFSQQAFKFSKETYSGSVDLSKDIWRSLFSQYFTATKILILCAIFTSFHITTLIDYGFNKENWYNFFTWQFVHRSYSHNISNCLIFFGFVGSPIAFSLFDLLVVSAYVYVISYYDPFLFYGASGLVFMFFGRMLNKKHIMQKYHLWYLPINVPYLALTYYCILMFIMMDLTSVRISDCLHLFCFFYGFFYDSTFIIESLQNLSKKALNRLRTQ